MPIGEAKRELAEIRREFIEAVRDFERSRAPESE
jgi:hypothetical protein